MIIFINTSNEPALIRPLLKLNGTQLVRCNGEWKESMLCQDASAVALKPLGFEVWLTGKAATTEATILQDALMRIDSFKEGVLPGDPPLVDSGNLIFPYEFTLYGDGGHCYRTWSLPVSSGATYDITCEMRKTGETAGIPSNRCLATGFRSSDDKNTYTRVAVFGEDIPTDGLWHIVNGTFNVKGDFSEWTIGLYNQMAPLDSDISIRNLKILRRPVLFGDATSCAIDGLVSIQGDGKFNFRNWRLPLVNGRRYRLSFEIRRSGPSAKDKALQAVIVGRKTTEKFIRVAQLGTDIPFDGKWYTVSGDFTATGDDGDEWRLGVYNCHAASDAMVEVRHLTISQLP